MPVLDRADQAFVDAFRTWLSEHLVGEFAAHRGRGGPADDEDWDLRIAWDRELAASGWQGISWPAEFGGGGRTVREEALLAWELARADAPYRGAVQGLELVGPMLLAYGSQEQKRRFLPPILAGTQFWAQGFSEPAAGSDLAGVQTRATLTNGEWHIDGAKLWTTTGLRANWLYVLARTEQASKRHHGLTMLLVPAQQPGVRIRAITNLCGSAEFCETQFEDARTAADLTVGAPGEGWRVAMGALGNERGLSLVGQQLRFIAEVRRLAINTGLATDAFRRRLSDVAVVATVAEWQAVRLIESAMSERPDPHFASAAKVAASTYHQRFAELIQDGLGAAGQITGSGYRLSDLQRSSLACLAETIYGGTTQIQLNLLAERALGLPRG